jgi:hypothetical protein
MFLGDTAYLNFPCVVRPLFEVPFIGIYRSIGQTFAALKFKKPIITLQRVIEKP